MTPRRLSWMACFLLGIGLAGCQKHPDRSTEELEKKVDTLTKKLAALHELVAKPMSPSAGGCCVGGDGTKQSASVGILEQPGLNVLTVPVSPQRVAGKKLVLDFTPESEKGPDICSQPLIPFLQFPVELFEFPAPSASRIFDGISSFHIGWCP